MIKGPHCSMLTEVTEREHVYRKHLLPQDTCQRCGKSFESPNQLRDHVRSVEACELRTGESQEGIDEAQHKALKSRKGTTGRGKLTEEQQWNNMYAICFPDDKSIPSPCKFHTTPVPALTVTKGDKMLAGHADIAKTNHKLRLNRWIPSLVGANTHETPYPPLCGPGYTTCLAALLITIRSK